eukprot:scaffold1629_cov369-Prasinococcus_capsulatus_cf.AAC.40
MVMVEKSTSHSPPRCGRCSAAKGAAGAATLASSAATCSVMAVRRSLFTPNMPCSAMAVAP